MRQNENEKENEGEKKRLVVTRIWTKHEAQGDFVRLHRSLSDNSFSFESITVEILNMAAILHTTA